MEIIGDVRDKVCVMIDDMIDTAGSVVQGAEALLDRGGAKEVHACCTHGVLSGKAIERICSSRLKSLVVTDTIPIPQEKRIPQIHVLSVAPLLADAILRIHQDDSVSDLFRGYSGH